MSNFCPDCLEGWNHSIPINRLDMSWSLSLCPLYTTLNLGCATSCLISHFVALRLTVSSSDWGDPLEIRLKKAALMDETSSHLQRFLAIPISSLSRTPSTLLLTYNNFRYIRESLQTGTDRRTEQWKSILSIVCVAYVWCSGRRKTSRRQRGQKRAEGLRYKSKNTCNAWGNNNKQYEYMKVRWWAVTKSGSDFSRWSLDVLIKLVWAFFKHFWPRGVSQTIKN